MKTKLSQTSRRDFLKIGGLATVGVLGFPAFIRGASSPASRRLRIGLIGTGGRGVNMCRDMVGLAEIVDIVAMCDVDPKRGSGGGKFIREKFPEVRQYVDYRKMLDAEKSIEAVIVTTPDHMHAPISMLAMSRGLHVFCEKPLTRTIWEARQMRQVAAKSGVVTQMGSQRVASSSLRRGIEVLRAGILGDIKEIHMWTNRKSALPAAKNLSLPMPEGMDWDLWTGVTPKVPFNNRFHPGRWRWWYQYGTGPLGDMGCHLTNMAFYGLDLLAPTEVDAKVGKQLEPGMFPSGSKLVYKFPEYKGRKALEMTWYDGGWLPKQELLASLGIKGEVPAGEGRLIVGTKGILWQDTYFKMHGEERLVGTSNHEACKAVPQTLPRLKEQGTSGHYREWIEACMGKGKPFSTFATASQHTEMVLVGALAQQLGRKIRWNSETMEVPGEPAAAAMIKPAYRPGFTI